MYVSLKKQTFKKALLTEGMHIICERIYQFKSTCTPKLTLTSVLM